MSRSLFNAEMLARMAPDGAGAAASPWVVIPRPVPPGRIKLVCIHHAGGGASAYRSWVRRLKSEVELQLVQLPGREERQREAPLTSADAVLTELVRALKPTLNGTYAIFGHSLGALLAYALVIRCQATAELPLPSHIFISGAPPPRKGDAAEVAPLQRDEDLLRHLRKLGGTPEVLLNTPKIRDAILPAIRADSLLCHELTRIKASPLDVPVTVLRGVNDPIMSARDAADWSAFSTKGVELLAFPGGHFFVQSAQQDVLAAVARVLARL